MAVNSLFTVHAVDYTASTGAQEAAQSTRATHLGAQDRSRDLTGATNGDVPNLNPPQGVGVARAHWVFLRNLG